jgi:hypothetical protein
MTGKTKLEARRRAREALARANTERAQRERDNVEDAATYVVAAEKLRDIDARETERLASLHEQVRLEAAKRRTEHRADAAAALARMQRRGETLTMITELTGEGFAEIRAMLRHSSPSESRTASENVMIRRADGDAAAPLGRNAALAKRQDVSIPDCPDLSGETVV